jgi:heat shock protein HslJ
MRIFLFSLLLLTVTVACRRPSSQFSAMMTPIAQPDDYSRYLKAGDDLVAMGNEPSWSLTVNPSKNLLHFKSLNGDSLTTPAPERQIDSDGGPSDGVIRYTVPVESGRMSAVFRPDSCIDKLSGQRFDYRVEIEFKGKTYTGCGASLRQLTLLNDIWVLTELQGRPIKPVTNKRELPRLEISLTEGRVSGTTGCNRFNGSIRADTRHVLFGPLATTRMACVGEGAELEGNFLAELNNLLTYQVGDRKLTFLHNGVSVMTFKKVD